jgi:uncharacterized protein YhjY with autotransporter beta-barrel domain
MNPVNFQGDLFWFQISYSYPMTLAFHEILSDYVYSLLQGANNVSLLAEQPHTLLRAENALLRQQLYPTQGCRKLYVPYIFCSGNYIPQGLPAVAVNVGNATSRGGDFLLGLTDRVSDLLTVGIAGGMQFQGWKSHTQGFTCRFDVQSEVLSLFASLAGKKGYLNTYGIYDWIQIPEFRRSFPTGPVSHHTRGRTGGNAWRTAIEGAWLNIGSPCAFKTGPYFQTAYQQVWIQGLRESGSDIGNLNYKHQATRSLVGGLGWDMRFHRDFSHWSLTSDFLLSFNRQFLHNNRVIRFQERNLSSGPYGIWPLGTNDVWFGTASFNLSALLPRDSSLTLGYTLNFGGHHLRESLISASFALPYSRKRC